MGKLDRTKTTVEISDALRARAKRHARSVARPLRALIEDGLSVGDPHGPNPLETLSQFHIPDVETAPYFARPFAPPKREVAPEWESPEAVGAPFISEPLAWEQICEQYPNEWVCLVEIDEINDTDFDFRTARVVGHGKTRKAPFDQARPFSEQYAMMGHYFTGHG